MLKLKNDSKRLFSELAELEQKNRDLYLLLQDISKYVTETYKKDFIITMIGRTNEEQAVIYKNDPKFQLKPFKSPHQFSHAVDIRSSIFTPEEIKGIEDYLNNKYNNSNFYKWTAKNHIVTGGAYHFHIQYVKK